VLQGTRVTGAGLKHLAGLKNLQTLVLIDTKVTDAGLKELAGLKNLRRLELQGTKVTREGAAELEKTLPRCTIFGLGVALAHAQPEKPAAKEIDPTTVAAWKKVGAKFGCYSREGGFTEQRPVGTPHVPAFRFNELAYEPG